MKNLYLQVLSSLQHLVVVLSFRLSRKTNQYAWVLGVNEIAGMVGHIAAALPKSYSYLLKPHQFYSSADYDFVENVAHHRNFFSRWWHQWIQPARDLGRLAALSEGFVYIGPDGFLIRNFDERDYEFKFLKKHHKKIVCYFTGNEIRSVKLMNQFELETGLPNIATWLPVVNPVFATEAYDIQKRRIAQVADEYADVIFNATIDQMSYLTRKSFPFLYFFPDEDISEGISKFDSYERPIVVHAPSSPIIKGTQIVRAAVKQLQEEGLDFEYVELNNESQAIVLTWLEKAHIVLNEFYSFVPGVLGVEAMAKGAALLTSADATIEKDLPEQSNSAWFPTQTHQISTHLRFLLTNKDAAAEYANNGLAWVRNHASYSASGKKMLQIITNTLEG